MLFSIGVAPEILRIRGELTPSRLASMTMLLHAVAQSGVIAHHDGILFGRQLAEMAHGISGPRARQLKLFATEIAKSPLGYTACPPGFRCDGNQNRSCVSCAKWARADAILVLDAKERQVIASCGASPSSILELDEYAASELAVERLRLIGAHRLDTLPASKAMALVGGALRFSRKIIVADKMVGIATKSGDVSKFLKGIAYIVDAWAAHSPYAGDGVLAIELLTVAGDTGGRAGFVSRAEAVAAIRDEWNRTPRACREKAFDIILKQDSAPQIFNDRLICDGERVWGLQHGLDDLGRLPRSDAAAHRIRLRPTMLDSPSSARGTVYRDLRALRDV